MDPKAKFKLHKMIKELERHRARHTELVSVYIPGGYSLDKVVNQLSQEAGTARNIKSATTRKNVTEALEKMIRHIRIYKRTPPNGVAVFSGNVSEREGVSDVKVWSIEPPLELKIRAYKCGQTFFMDPLIEMGIKNDMFALIVIDRREADIATLSGKTIRPIKSFTSQVPGKTRAGGQSAARFERVREGLAKDFFRKVGEVASKEFESIKELQGVIVGGPGPTKETFIRGSFLSQKIKDQIIGVLDIGYCGEHGLDELVNKAADILQKEEIIKEKRIVDKLFQLLNTRPSYTTYGKVEVKKALERKAVEMLLISEQIPESEIEELAVDVEGQDGEWVLISKETREGVQLIGLGGIAAILRFPIE